MTNTNTTSKTSSKFAFTFDHVSKAIVGTDVNFQKAGIPDSKQEKELMARIEAHPNYSFKVIETEKKPAKQTYKGLTSELMKEYISIQAEEKQADLMAQLDKMIKEKMAYPTIKSWFLEEFKGFSVSKAKSQIKNYKGNQNFLSCKVRPTTPLSTKRSVEFSEQKDSPATPFSCLLEPRIFVQEIICFTEHPPQAPSHTQ